MSAKIIIPSMQRHSRKWQTYKGKGSCERITAELWRILLGMVLARDRGFKQIVIERDSLSAIKMRTNQDKSSQNHNPIINKLRS
ncbi:Putative ribonuclease H protein [Arachis hypogaea]|nr:Putative ribonuclease H protein [Arachis hypogaea]